MGFGYLVSRDKMLLDSVSPSHRRGCFIRSFAGTARIVDRPKSGALRPLLWATLWGCIAVSMGAVGGIETMSDAAKAKDWRTEGVKVVPASSLDPNTPQTPGMSRAAAINFARAGAEKLWAGTVTIHP